MNIKTRGTSFDVPVRFGRTMLDQVITHGIAEPTQLVDDVLLEGDAHQIFCGPGGGKSWLALWLIKNVMQQDRRAIFFDMENGKRIIADRLRDLGINSADEYLHYFYIPSMDVSEGSRGEYAGLLEDVEPSLIVFDSWVGCLGACGLDENSNNDVEQWSTIYVNEAKARGCTVLILDHVPHEGNRSRGATRKKDLVDVQWNLKKVDKFDRSTVGYVELRKEKDREAYLPHKVGFSIGGTEAGFMLRRSSGLAFNYQQGDGLTPSARAALEALETFEDRGATYTDWRTATKFKDKGMGDSTFRKAIEKLLAGENPHIYQDNGRYYSTTALSSTQAALV